MTLPQVYVIDDDASVRRALQRLFSSSGFAVQAFPSAQSFLDSVPQDAEGCAIIDVRMPDIDGFSLLEKLTELCYRVKVIIITAYASDFDRKKALESGAIGYLQKPFSDRSIFDLIQSAM